MKKKKGDLRKELAKLVMIATGIMSAALGLKGFLIPNEFIDGGATGITLLISSLTDWPVSALLIVINLPFIWLGYRRVDKVFAVKTLVAILVLATILYFVNFPLITHDKVLTAVFGGFFLGLGIGLAMRGGCVIDGTEVLALYISKNSILTVGNIILILNIIIFAFAAYFLNIETSLYAILTYLSASYTIDFIINGIEQYTGVTIISEHQEEIKDYIITEMKRGVTIYKGEGGYGERKDIDILFTVVTKLEMSKLQTAIRNIDSDAFVIQQQIADLKGGVVKRHALH